MNRAQVVDGVALAVGTLTRVPTRPPASVDRQVAGVAMVLAPWVGAVLGLVVGVAAQLLADHTTTGALLTSAGAVSVLAYATRALHLDGLADTADALGSGRPPAQALEVARRSDIGPFGVVTLVLILLVQVAALAPLLADGRGALALVVALGGGRLAITLACTRGIPAARSDGLGAAVAQSVPVPVFVAAAGGWLAVVAGVGLLAGGLAAAVGATVSAVAGVAAGAAVLRIGVRRLGGITGDVLGAVTEVGATATLVALVLAGGLAA